MAPFFHLLAQMKDVQLDGRPPLTADVGTSPLTWILAFVLTAGVLLVTFKTSKRNHMEND